MTVNAFQLEWH